MGIVQSRVIMSTSHWFVNGNVRWIARVTIWTQFVVVVIIIIISETILEQDKQPRAWLCCRQVETANVNVPKQRLPTFFHTACEGAVEAAPYRTQDPTLRRSCGQAVVAVKELAWGSNRPDMKRKPLDGISGAWL